MDELREDSHEVAEWPFERPDLVLDYLPQKSYIELKSRSANKRWVNLHCLVGIMKLLKELSDLIYKPTTLGVNFDVLTYRSYCRAKALPIREQYQALTKCAI